MALSNMEMAEVVAKVGKPRSGFAKPPLDIDVAKALELRAAGFSCQQIGDYFGCSRITIIRRFRAHREGKPTRAAWAPMNAYAALAARGIRPKEPEADTGPDFIGMMLNARMKKEA